MAYVFISDSSRRPQQIPEDAMQANWDGVFGKKEKMICLACGKPAFRLHRVAGDNHGVCDECLQAHASEHERIGK
jgi:hypothetical protein